ncbi:MAG: FAD-binding oxidoreductase, partial [Pseudomonadota bacterium]|nr:FAD-binding oxidoreductase [Pseudomonadota bacterium]
MVWQFDPIKPHNCIMSNPINSYPNSWYVASSPMLAEQRHASGDLAYDVCVVGGGYTGLSCALHLATAGKSVAVLEAERVGWGASGRNGGHVGTGQRANQHSLEKWYGKATARELWRLGLEAVDLVTDLIKENDINCELGTTNIHFAAKKSHVDELRDEVDYLRNQYDYHQISGVESSSLEELTSGIGFHYGVIDHGARHLHPLKYCLGLAAAAMKAGASVFEKSQVKNIDIRRDLAIVTTDKAVIKAQRVVLACNGYLGNLFQPIAGNIMPINNFIVATEPLDEATANRINPLNASMSDSLFVINYWKLSEDRRLIFGGGETYSDKFPVSVTDFVRPKLLAIYPELSDVKLIYGWGGTLAITRNRMPDLGVHKGVVYYAQGFSG